ncbi:MAG: prenyltransferase/squalene oxidase repeat-containing protein [Thermoguttaceae bacterium]|jgi:hypothetical protein
MAVEVKAVAEAAAAEEQEEQYQDDDSLGARFMDWVRTELVWYAGSFTFHVIGLSLLLLIPSAISDSAEDTRRFDEVKAEKEDSNEPQKFEKYDIGDPDDKPPPELDVDPTLEKAGHAAQEEEYNDDSDKFEHKGGGMVSGSKDVTSGMIGFSGVGSGAKATGQGIGVGLGTGKNWGSGGDGTGFGGRGSGHRKAMLAQAGGTKRTERAVTGALIWLARHQLSDGSWSLKNYLQRCSDRTCTGPGSVDADTGATAMGVLPFLAAGQTHRTKGPYRANVSAAVQWLIRHQKADGNLAAGIGQPMYSHGLATIALCEDCGMTGDDSVRLAAQRAVDYIVMAQNKATGGWRYTPGEEGDTSVVGWQVMALKSAIMAGLNVGGSGGGGASFNGASKWLDSVQSGANNSLYAYQPGSGPQNTMTAVGLLCRQYLGAKRETPMMTDGVKYLMDNMPGEDFRHASNIYYDYYATQVLHNMNNYEWDTWNRRMRELLVKSQNRDSSSCANGSWDPAGDQWASRGGRVMMTSLAALTLEIYYRYLPLFKAEIPAGGAVVDNAPAAKAAAADAAAPPAKKDAAQEKK